MKNKTRVATTRMVRAAMVAAIYVAICYAAAPISFGAIQVRVSEAMVLLPLIFPEAIAGLAIGCLISNFLLSIPLDAALGATATLLAACLTWLFGRLFKREWIKVAMGVIPPVLANMFVVPIVLLTAGWNDGYGYFACVGLVGAGEAIAVICFGIPIYAAVSRAYKAYRGRRSDLPAKQSTQPLPSPLAQADKPPQQQADSTKEESEKNHGSDKPTFM